jgi:hypothetical protein
MVDPASRDLDNVAVNAVLAIRADPVKVDAVLAATGITKQALWQWTRVPLERVLAVSRAIHVPPHMIRPDHYPPPRKRRRAEDPGTQPQS